MLELNIYGYYVYFIYNLKMFKLKMNILDKISAIYEEQISLLISELRYIEIKRHDIYEMEQHTMLTLSAIDEEFNSSEYCLSLEKFRQSTKDRCQEHKKLYKNFEDLIQAYRKSIVVLYNEMDKLQYAQGLTHDQNTSITPVYKEIC